MLKITPALIDAFAKNLKEREYSPATISKYVHDARARSAPSRPARCS